jgi:hypothetical protein
MINMVNIYAPIKLSTMLFISAVGELLCLPVVTALVTS